jgi:creatinine amidohydrolase
MTSLLGMGASRHVIFSPSRRALSSLRRRAHHRGFARPIRKRIVTRSFRNRTDRFEMKRSGGVGQAGGGQSRALRRFRRRAIGGAFKLGPEAGGSVYKREAIVSGRAAILVVLALLATPAVAQPPDTVALEELTWPELRALVQAGKTTIILPIGGTEQNGPHMALGKHNVRVRALAERIARELGNAVVAPVIAYVPEGGLNPPTGHMRFPGTITVPDDVFRRTLESAARSLRLAGFRDVVFLGDHGSTQAGEKAVAARLNREWAATPARVHAIEEYYRAATAGFRELLQARGHRPEELGEHAALPDTSLTLAVAPGLVRADPPRDAQIANAGSGVDGDPRRASPELGRLGVDLIVARTVAAIKASTNRR